MPTGIELRIGDPVSWIDPAGFTTGRVVKLITSPQWVSDDGRLGSRVRASETRPYFLVRSDLGSRMVALRPEQLTKV